MDRFHLVLALELFSPTAAAAPISHMNARQETTTSEKQKLRALMHYGLGFARDAFTHQRKTTTTASSSPFTVATVPLKHISDGSSSTSTSTSTSDGNIDGETLKLIESMNLLDTKLYQHGLELARVDAEYFFKVKQHFDKDKHAYREYHGEWKTRASCCDNTCGHTCQSKRC
jgi:hypothetical protein